MRYNFDTVIDRRGTNALKTDVLFERYGSTDLLPMWVADMDFASPPAVSEAIIERAKHPVFGYTCAGQGYYDAIINWLAHRHRWEIEQSWLDFVPGIVKGIAFAIDCFVKPDEKIIIQPPVYHPFSIIPTLHHRELVFNPLVLQNGQYEMDFEQLRSVITPDCRMLILCNPHNPGGRVWNADELRTLANICSENNILVISDEIHCDLVHSGYQHTPFATVSQEAAQRSITFMAPSKTFNIAGIVSSYSIIINEELRNRFSAYMVASELNEGHIFAYLAAEAAYRYGEEWLKEAISYIEENVNTICNFINKYLPEIQVIRPEASFLVWLDFRQLCLSQKDLVSLCVQKARLALNDGAMFGIGGDGFMRMNIGTPRSVVMEALERLRKTFGQDNF